MTKDCTPKEQFYEYWIYAIERETEKALRVRFAADIPGHTRHGKPWCRAWWFPKSAVKLSADKKFITVPVWLIEQQMNQASEWEEKNARKK